MSLTGIAQETLQIVERGHYQAPSGARVEIGEAVAAARAGTRTYTPDEVAGLARSGPLPERAGTAIEVTTEGTTGAGQRLFDGGHEDVCVLNFASARNVGGGFLNGARAQEEELCRGSALYHCLETQRDYYQANRAHRSAVYTDHLIYSPGVPFFRDEARALRERPALLSVITSPAPNTGAVRNRDGGELPALREAFYRRAAHVLAVAAGHGHPNLVLGAWGCGAFQGDPVLAADAFGVALEGRFARAFQRVVFAVLVKGGRDTANLQAFRARFGS